MNKGMHRRSSTDRQEAARPGSAAPFASGNSGREASGVPGGKDQQDASALVDGWNFRLLV